ncbi:MAG: hypothetical protein JRC90_09055 [Deltaproteobacteria bacterium]|nr:hypothetical protein [Deltaproteobacteria bacterium]
MGIESVVHPDSLETVISAAKKRTLGDPEVLRTYIIFLKNNQNGNLRVCVSLYPLGKPSGTFLVLAEPEGG